MGISIKYPVISDAYAVGVWLKTDSLVPYKAVVSDSENSLIRKLPSMIRASKCMLSLLRLQSQLELRNEMIATSEEATIKTTPTFLLYTI